MRLTLTLSYTDSKAKLVRWSHAHTVPLLPLDNIWQPSDDQLPPSSLDLREKIKSLNHARCFFYTLLQCWRSSPRRYKAFYRKFTPPTSVCNEYEGFMFKIQIGDSYRLLCVIFTLFGGNLLFKVPVDAFIYCFHIWWLENSKLIMVIAT